MTTKIFVNEGQLTRDWDGDHHPAAFYKFTPDRRGQWPQGHLKDFSGWLHANGYAGFEELCRRGSIKEVACLAHMRRKFFDIHVAQGSSIAKEALEPIAALYQIEASIRGKPPDERKTVKQELATSLIDELEVWLHVQLMQISGKLALAGAIRYGLTRLKRLHPYLSDGRLAIDNNVAERGMRSILPLYGLGQRRQIGGYCLYADRNSKAQRCESTGLANRYPWPHRQPQDQQGLRAAALAIRSTR